MRLTLSGPPGAPGIPPHGYSLLVVNHIVQIGEGARKLPAIDGLRRFAGVFEGDTKVRAAGSSGFSRLDLCCCVADLWKRVSYVSCCWLEMWSSI